MGIVERLDLETVVDMVTVSKDCPARWIWLGVVSIDKSLLKGEASRFSVDLDPPLSCEKGPLIFHTPPPRTGLGH
jgi:hypothetical protein